MKVSIQSVSLLKRGILFFWAVWFSIVLATNLGDGLKAIGLLPGGWPFASGNYDLILKVTSVYSPPEWSVAVLFIGVLIWEGVATFLFWRAAKGFRGASGESLSKVYAAFCVGIGLWAVLMLADEFFLAFQMEAGHLGIFSGQLISLLAIRLLPDE